MKLLECELKGYIRMSLSGRSHFVYKPTMPIQLVLGTNGSGKSSLLFEIFPFPALKEDFLPGGFKKLHYEHQGKEYKLHSYYKNSREMTHEFHEKQGDGSWVNLNEGGTQKIQLELAKDIFRLTPAIRSVLLNKEKFSMMSPSKRRELFVSMSDADYTFAFSLYNSSRDRLRTNSGVIKFLKESIVTKTSALLKENEIEALEERAKELHRSLTELYNLRSPIPQEDHDIESRIHRGIAHLDTLTKTILSHELSYPYFLDSTDPESAKEMIRVLESDVRVIRAEMQNTQQEHQKLTADVAVLKESGGQDQAQVASVIEEDKARLNGLISSLSRDWNIPRDGILPATQAFRQIYSDIARIFGDQKDNSENSFSKSRLEEKKEARRQATEASHEFAKKIRSLQGELQHYEHHRNQKPVECPKCRHNWQIGFDQNRYDQVKLDIESIHEKEKALTKQVEVLHEEISEIETFLFTYMEYVNTSRAVPALAPLWAILNENHVAFKWPKEALSIIQTFYTDLPVLEEIGKVHEYLKEQSSLLTRLKALDLASAQSQEERMKHLDQEMYKSTEAIRTINNQINQLEHYITQCRELENLRSDLENHLQKLDTMEERLMVREYQSALHESIRLIQSELNQKEEVLNNAKNDRQILQDLKDKLEFHELREQAIKVLIKTMSPTEGLIAEGLTGFINNYIAQKNKVINSIWSYEMELLPCRLEENGGADLDYRFPVHVKNKPHPLKDIVEGSSGMQEMVDLAYRIVYMKYAGLEEIPLFLDEFGSGFDEHHQHIAIQAIRSIIEQMGFEQTFIISHHKSSYGGLSNAELCVVCDANIEVPADIPRVV